MEAATLLTADKEVAQDFSAAVKRMNEANANASTSSGAGAGDTGQGQGQEGAVAAAAARLAGLRDAVGVHRLSDAQVAKVISRRVDAVG